MQMAISMCFIVLFSWHSVRIGKTGTSAIVNFLIFARACKYMHKRCLSDVAPLGGSGKRLQKIVGGVVRKSATRFWGSTDTGSR